ncbi:hypothetical protein HDU96_004863, partial [Phlyctochytrium bullatum]
MEDPGGGRKRRPKAKIWKWWGGKGIWAPWRPIPVQEKLKSNVALVRRLMAKESSRGGGQKHAFWLGQFAGSAGDDDGGNGAPQQMNQRREQNGTGGSVADSGLRRGGCWTEEAAVVGKNGTTGHGDVQGAWDRGSAGCSGFGWMPSESLGSATQQRGWKWRPLDDAGGNRGWEATLEAVLILSKRIRDGKDSPSDGHDGDDGAAATMDRIRGRSKDDETMAPMASST